MTGFRIQMQAIEQFAMVDDVHYPFEDLTDDEIVFLWNSLVGTKGYYFNECFFKPSKIYKMEELDDFLKSQFLEYDTSRIDRNQNYFIFGAFNKLESFNNLRHAISGRYFYHDFLDIENADDKLTLYRIIKHYSKEDNDFNSKLVEKLQKANRQEVLEIAYKLEKLFCIKIPYFH